MTDPSTPHTSSTPAARSSGADQPDADQPDADSDDVHRGFVRDINQRFARVYGVGGAAVVVAVAGVIAAAAAVGGLGSPVTWIAAVVAFLAGLVAVRAVVRRRAASLVDEVDQYCALNDVGADQLRAQYAGDDLYPFFASIFDVLERRGQLRGPS